MERTGEFEPGTYEAKSYVGGHRPWRTVTVHVCKCPAHTFRPRCARLGAICYPTQDFQSYERLDPCTTPGTRVVLPDGEIGTVKGLLPGGAVEVRTVETGPVNTGLAYVQPVRVEDLVLVAEG